jgi:hypothetical protein
MGVCNGFCEVLYIVCPIFVVFDYGIYVHVVRQC